MDNQTLAMAIAVLSPLLGACLWFWMGNLFTKKYSAKTAEKIVTIGTVSALVISFICVGYLFLNIEGSARLILFEWIRLNASSAVSFSFLVDPLSLTLGLVVTGVGSLIHLYATSYMHGDPGFGRFFTYLNLFVFSMLMLTFSDSLVGIFLGWEGVGVCSYLLISFWFTEEPNASAGKKAFIVNRIGDLGFMLAMACLFKLFGTLNIPEILAAVKSASFTVDQMFWIKLACFGLVLGACGKSAQIPLYVWLPDAMAGPTPVSALIHAATMVTAGVYLTCRLQALFLLNLDVLEILAFIGGLTALFAASIAVFQDDIKKVLAYSTISQLGYMFLAVGLLAPVAAYFHLVTHAFFKALLFLGAGSVIHGLHHEQDMRHMGGLRTKMPITFWTVTIGVLAIAGIPPLSGFVSKDEILHFAWHSHRWYLIFFAFLTAFLTSFYMGRLWVMTFFGKFRGHHEAHESPLPMTLVLVVLAVLSAAAGFLNWPELWGGHETLGEYLRAIVTQTPQEHTAEAVSGSINLAVISSLVGLSGLALAYFKYRNFSNEKQTSPALASIFKIFKNKYYVDEIYDTLFVRNLKGLGFLLWKGVDVAIIDGILNGFAHVSNKLSSRTRRFQTGMAQQYALWVWVGFLILLFGAWTMR